MVALGLVASFLLNTRRMRALFFCKLKKGSLSRQAPQQSRFLVRANYEIPHLGPPVVSSPLYMILRLLYEPWTCVRLFS